MAFTDYTIVPTYDAVILDEVGYQNVSMSGIPSTVHAIQWNGITFSGTIQYKQLSDGTIPANDSFSDPADYYNQTKACQDPLVCYSTSDSSTYGGNAYLIGSQLTIFEWPHPAIPAGFTGTIPSAQTLSYTSLFWFNSAFVWSLFDPSDTLADAKSTSIDWVDEKAYTILEPSDWYVIREYENSTTVPPTWSTWRQLIRDEASSKNVDIAACASINDLFTYTTATAFDTWTSSPA